MTDTTHIHRLPSSVIAVATTSRTGQHHGPAELQWHNPHLHPDHADALLLTLTPDTFPGPLTVNSTTILNATATGLNHLLDLLAAGNNNRRLDLPIHTLYQRIGPHPSLTNHMHKQAAHIRTSMWANDPDIPVNIRIQLNPHTATTALYNHAHRIHPATITELAAELDHIHTHGLNHKKLHLNQLLTLLATHTPEHAIAAATPHPRLHRALLASAAATCLNPADYLTGGPHHHYDSLHDTELLTALRDNPWLTRRGTDITWPTILSSSWTQWQPRVLPHHTTTPPATHADINAICERITTADPTINLYQGGPHHAPLTTADRVDTARHLLAARPALLTDTQHASLTDLAHNTTPSPLRPHRNHTATAITNTHTLREHQLVNCRACRHEGTSVGERLADAVAVLDATFTTDTQWDLCYQLADHFTGTSEQLADTVTHLAAANRTPAPDPHP